MSMITNLLEKMGMLPIVEGHVLGCGCKTCVETRQQKQVELINRRARGVAGDSLADLLLERGEYFIERTLFEEGKTRSFWLGVLTERLTIMRGRDEATLAWVSERGWSNSLRAEHGRQQRAIRSHASDLCSTLVADRTGYLFPLKFWQGVLCERYISLAEGRLSVADKRRMGLRWFTSEENIAQMMVELMHSMGRIGPNGVAWMTEQLHQRGGADKNYVYDLQRARDILRAACNMMDATP